MYSNACKFYFIHSGKCAGTSIKTAIQEQVNDCRMARGHPGPYDIEAAIRSDGFDPDDYFKFTSIRNPWDRVVSLYHHMKTVAGRNPANAHMQFNGTFADFVRHFRFSPVDVDNMDFVIKYENLNYWYRQVCKKIGIAVKELPRIDYNTGRGKTHYTKYYDDELRMIVAEKCKQDINEFNYTFRSY